MKLSSKFVLVLLLILSSFVSVSDYIYRHGHPITFDGHIHMTTMNQFAQALYDGEFPVRWANNFANYGHPLANIAHQTPAYLGAALILMGVSTEIAFTSLLTLTVIITSFLFYIFFRKYANESISFTATILSTFFPYKALNIYTRGALPELMATMFLPVLLLGIYYIQKKDYFKSALYIYFGVFLTAITHPMMLLVFSVPVGAYFIYSLSKQTLKKDLLISSIAVSLGLMSASYYLLPLLLEIKYFYQGNIESSVGTDSFLSLKQMYDPTWYYTLTHPGPRANYIKLGTIEFLIIVLAITLILKLIFFYKHKLITNNIESKFTGPLKFWTGLSSVLILLMLPISQFLYRLPVISQLQYPWRFLTALQITIPLVFIFLLLSIKKLQSKYFLLAFIALILLVRTPQFYGKNYVVQPESDYYFNKANLHSNNLNTVWSGDTLEYKTKTVQSEIVEGDGIQEIIEEKNASRKYKFSNKEEIRVVDYTFYFSGWATYIDGEKTIMQWQDPNYRGIITYKVPAGDHEVDVIYENTNIRFLGMIVSLSSFFLVAYFLYIVKTD
jgi:hypothetical protein